MKSRFHQTVLIGSTVGLCWLGMQIVHELGHLAAAHACGETIHKVVLHPMAISRTDTSHDHHPLLVIWSGPLVGACLPLGFLAIARAFRAGLLDLFRFFAGFCLIANGAYLGVGSFSSVGDAGDLLRYAAPQWELILFGLVSVPGGLFLWNGIGRSFGLGEAKGAVDRKAVLWVTVMFWLIVIVEFFANQQ